MMYNSSNLIMIHIVLLSFFISLISPFNLDLKSPYIVTSDSENYFGFSVALHKNNQGNFLLVGAPVSDTPQVGVEHGGALYKCRVPDILGDPTSSVTCSEEVTNLDATGNKYVNRYDLEGYVPESYSYNKTEIFNLQKEEKSHQWLGVTIQSTPDSKYLLGCAHKYETRYLVISSYRDDPPRQLTGKCTMLDQEFEPLDLTYEPCYGEESGLTKVGNCQAGTSAFLYDTSLVLGAPGCYEGSGGLYMYDVEDPVMNRYTHEAFIDMDYEDSLPYIGYSTVICDLNSDGIPDLITGGPRGKLYEGLVLIYQSTPTLELVQSAELPFDFELKGEQMGSYYGHSLLCQDMNGDGIDDLVVGAPWYTIYDDQKKGRPDIGRIYFYPGSKTLDSFEFLPYDYDLNTLQKITGRDASEAFGFSLSTAGDVNNDGINDMLVGSPFSNDGEGKVYLFLGSTDGIITIPAQIITPTRLGVPNNLRGFGWSVAGGKDMDGNGISDVLIGSYLSHHAVLLRSVPVIDVEASVEVVGGDVKIHPDSEPNLDVPGVGKVRGIELQACFQYTGSSGVSGFGEEVKIVNFKIKLDSAQGSEKSRLYTNYSLPSQIQLGQVELNLKTKERICTPPFPAYFRGTLSYSSSPLQFSMNAGLEEKEVFEERAVLNQQSIAGADFSLFIASDCPDETGVCTTDMSLEIGEAQYDRQDTIPLVIGLVNDIIVPVTVTNKGPNTAYGSKLLISSVPAVLPFIGPRSDCNSTFTDDMEDDDTYSIVCTLDANLKVGTAVSVPLELNLTRMTAPREFNISVTVTVLDPSIVVSSDGGIAVLALDVQNLAEIQLRRGSSDDRLLYNNKYGIGNKVLGYAGPIVKHAYELLLSDDSIGRYVKDIRVSIFWPLNFPDGSWLFPLLKVDEQLKNRAGEVIETSEDFITCDYTLVTDWDLIAETFNPPDQIWTDVDCRQNRSLCHEITCSIKELERGGGRLKLSFYSRVEEYFLQGFDELFVRSFAEIRSCEEGMILPRDVSASVSTSLVPSSSKSINMTWIIIIAVLGGLLILAIILLILWKCGFFKRVRPEPEPPMTVGYRNADEEEILLPQGTKPK